MSIYGYSKVSVNLIVDRTLSLQRAPPYTGGLKL